MIIILKSIILVPHSFLIKQCKFVQQEIVFGFHCRVRYEQYDSTPCCYFFHAYKCVPALTRVTNLFQINWNMILQYDCSPHTQALNCLYYIYLFIFDVCSLLLC